MGQLSFGLLSYAISGEQIHIRHRQDGEMCEALYRGTIEDLHTPQNKELHDSLDMMEVLFIGAEDGELLIGLDGEG